MADKKFKGISVITAGPALGHDMMIDQTTLEQVMELGNQNSPVKVLANHSNDVGEVIGMLSNFRISGQRVRADFELLENHPQSEYFAELLTKLPDQLGFSISFSGVPRSDENGVQLADVRDLWSVDLVTRAAANKSIYEGAVDSKRAVSMNKAEPAPVAKLEAPVEAAPAAPAAPVAEPAALAEPTMADINAKLDMILALLAADASEDAAPEMPEAPEMAAKTEETKLEAAVVEEAPAAVEPAKDEQPAPVAAEAKAEVKELSQPVPSVIAAKVIELEASRGVQPLEVSTETAFSRADLLSQFNAEKDPRRAAEIFKKLKLAR